MAGSVFVDTSLKESDLMHTSHHCNKIYLAFEQLLKEHMMCIQISQMRLGIVDKTVSPCHMKYDIRSSKKLVRILDREQITFYPLCSIINLIGHKISCNYFNSILQKLLYNSQSKISISSCN